MRRWNIVVPDDLAERVDRHLDGRNLSAFVRRAVEQRLDRRDGAVEQALVTEVGGGSPGVSKASLPAPAEQPRKREKPSGHLPTCKCPVCK